MTLTSASRATEQADKTAIRPFNFNFTDAEVADLRRRINENSSTMHVFSGGDNMTTGKEAGLAAIDMKLEVIVIPVSDAARAEQFYRKLGWRQDVTPPGSGVFQFTPHGSACSVQFGKGLTSAAPGSAQRTYLIVSDIEATRNALVDAGIDVCEIFHLGPNGPVGGPDPEHGSYRSLATFSDPDGNSWLLQEITTRLPGRIDTGVTSFGSASDLAKAMRRAEAAHGEHEKRLEQRNANWSDWYAEYMAAEQSGAELPT